MQLDLANFIAEHADQFDEEVKVIPEYSGRGMYGSTTAALSVRSPLVLAKLAFLMNELLYEAVENGEVALYEIDDFRSDQLGLGYVVY